MKNDGAWVNYAKTTVEFIPSDQEAFTIRPAPPGTTGEWPTELQAPLYIITAWNPGRERPGGRGRKLHISVLPRPGRVGNSEVSSRLLESTFAARRHSD